jgi:hypothetical protein
MNFLFLTSQSEAIILSSPLAEQLAGALQGFQEEQTEMSNLFKINQQLFLRFKNLMPFYNQHSTLQAFFAENYDKKVMIEPLLSGLSTVEITAKMEQVMMANLPKTITDEPA